MRKSTIELEELLQSIPQERLDSIVDEIDEYTFCNYLSTLLNQYQVNIAELIRKTTLHRTYAYQIINGTREHVSRDKIIQIILALQCTLDECNRLLILGHHEKLYSNKKRDAILIYSLTNKLSVTESNELLLCKNQPPLD